MQQTFDVLSLVQVFNPLYALPIVAVILCAFLVYAFGFKKPVQPPSFDELLEVEKKPTKKRKVKDSQKAKQQNGKIPTHVGKSSESLGTSGKKKSEKLSIKAEEKAATKKNTVAEKKKKPNANQLPSPIIEDNNDEGWVHHVSKKGRKNRKKDDGVQHEMMEAFIQNDTLAVENLGNLQKNSQLEDEIINGPKETVEVVNMKEAVVEKLTDVQVKPLGKQNANKKQAAKGKIDSVSDTGKVSAYPKVEDQVCRNGLPPPNVESESSELESSAASDPMKTIKEQPKRPKKKKKKKQDEEEIAVDVPSGVPAVDESLPSFPSSKSAVSSGLPIVNSHEVTDNMHQVNELDDNVGLIVDEPKDVNNFEVENKGSNVAFDELEGLYSDTKVAKKKKRVRRDH